MTNEEIKLEIARLEKTMTGNFLKDVEIGDEIHALSMKLNGVKSINDECPIDGSCDSCGA